MVSINVSSAGKPPAFARSLPFTAEFPGKKIENITVADVKASISAKFPKFYSSRQKITLKGDKRLLGDDATLKDLGVEDGGELSVKDLGPQISWRVVFMVEYAGPLIIHPIIYYLPELFYGSAVQHSALQKYVFAFVMLHFLKRELETLFVHRFSHGTMPARNIIKNSAHYHILSGLALAYDVYRPKFSAPSLYVRGTIRDDQRFLWACAAVFIFAEFSNLSTHLTLRSLRPEGSRKRGIPYGYGFSLVSCPNYFFEIVAWLTISIMTNSLASWVFLAVATGQMTIWAIKKHKGYKKDFGKEYPKRWVMVPFIF